MSAGHRNDILTMTLAKGLEWAFRLSSLLMTRTACSCFYNEVQYDEARESVTERRVGSALALKADFMALVRYCVTHYLYLLDLLHLDPLAFNLHFFQITLLLANEWDEALKMLIFTDLYRVSCLPK